MGCDSVSSLAARELIRIADALEASVEIARESLKRQETIIELQQKSAQANKDLAALLRTMR